MRAKKREAQLDKDVKSYYAKKMPTTAELEKGSAAHAKSPTLGPIGTSDTPVSPHMGGRTSAKTPDLDFHKSQELREEEADEVWSLAYDVMSEFNEDGVDRLLSAGASTASSNSRISP